MKNSRESEKPKLQKELRSLIVSGNVDVNIMTKVNKINYEIPCPE